MRSAIDRHGDFFLLFCHHSLFSRVIFTVSQVNLFEQAQIPAADFFEISFGERDYRKSLNCSPVRMASMSAVIVVFLTPRGGKKI